MRTLFSGFWVPPSRSGQLVASLSLRSAADGGHYCSRVKSILEKSTRKQQEEGYDNALLEFQHSFGKIATTLFGNSTRRLSKTAELLVLIFSRVFLPWARHSSLSLVL